MDFSADREKLAGEAMGVGKVSEISQKPYYRKCSDCIVTCRLDIYQVIFHLFFSIYFNKETEVCMSKCAIIIFFIIVYYNNFILV